MIYKDMADSVFKHMIDIDCIAGGLDELYNYIYTVQVTKYHCNVM